MASPTKFYHMIQIILYICSCDQSLVTLPFLWEKLSQPQFYKDLTRKTAFFDGWFWFKFNNLGLTLGTNLKLYTSVGKGLKVNGGKFWGLIPTFVGVTGEKLEAGVFLPTPTPLFPLFLNRIKKRLQHKRFLMNIINVLGTTWTEQPQLLLLNKSLSISKELFKKEESGKTAFALISLFYVQIQEPASSSTTTRASVFSAKFAEFYYQKIFETRSWWRLEGLLPRFDESSPCN